MCLAPVLSSHFHADYRQLGDRQRGVRSRSCSLNGSAQFCNEPKRIACFHFSISELIDRQLPVGYNPYGQQGWILRSGRDCRTLPQLPLPLLALHNYDPSSKQGPLQSRSVESVSCSPGKAWDIKSLDPKNKLPQCISTKCQAWTAILNMG